MSGWWGLDPVELSVVLCALVLLASRWSPEPVRRHVVFAAVALGSAAVVVLLVNGVRWQLTPVLVAIALTTPLLVGAVRGRRARPWLAATGTGVLVLVVALGPAASWALPVPHFPTPTGRYAVGTTERQWTDHARTDTDGAARIVVAQFWYPATATGARSPYLGSTPAKSTVVADGLADYLGVPRFVLDGLPRATTAASLDTPAARGRFPLVLFSPGLGGVRTQNTAWAEELASRGYVVIGLDHPFDSAVVVLADGRAIPTAVTATGDDEVDQATAQRCAETRALDLRFALDALSTVNATDPLLRGRLAVDRAAAAGHSLGGGAAMMAAGQDKRFQAVVNLDGYPYSAGETRYPPLLILHHPVPPNDEFTRAMATALPLSSDGTRTEIPGSAHLTFTDAPLYLPPLPTLTGTLGRHHPTTLTADLTDAFLTRVLPG
ncbi:alpha/beta hydrolase family protein [Actinokineospora sp. G85]|uniref:alpha/beta hydrolase family protein n=1 Tax=Actinokineospora sp. G85 TaxID=3406626 RepID=UPI003C73D18C